MVAVFHALEAVHHVEILFGAGGVALAVLQYVFPFALVGLTTGLAGGGGPPSFCGDYMSASLWQWKQRKSARFDKSESLQDRF